MKYPCPLSSTPCKYAGDKSFDYGFVSGSGTFCRHPTQKTFVDRILFGQIVCPKLSEMVLAKRKDQLHEREKK